MTQAARIKSVFPGVRVYTSTNQLVVRCSKAELLPLRTFLKQSSARQYRALRDISATDYPERRARYEVYYALLSRTYGTRLRVTVSLSEAELLPSVTSLYAGAGWYERELWDRFGLYISGHPDLRRRLTDYGFKGHPLRKDFPTTGYIEVRYDGAKKRIRYEAVALAQEPRLFRLSAEY